MSHYRFKSTVLFIFGIVLLSVLSCFKVPSDPLEPSKTDAGIVLKSPTVTSDDLSTFTDSVGTDIKIGVRSNLMMNIDSVTLTIRSESNGVDTTVRIYDFVDMQVADTVWISYPLRDTGTFTIYSAAFVHDWKTVTDTVTIAVYLPVNHPPRMAITGERRVLAGEKCSLTVVVSDADKRQKLTFSIDTMPNGSYIDSLDNSFVWLTDSGDTGSTTMMFRVVDNGYPALADSQVVEVVVALPAADRVDEKKPAIKLLTPNDSAVVSTDSVQVKVVCTDASGIASVTCSMGEDTFAISSTTDDSIYTATISGLEQDVYNPILVIATDASPQHNTDTLRLYLNYDPTLSDDTPPAVRLVVPATDTIIATDSCRIELVCIDASGIGSVIGTVGETEFTGVKKSGSDSLWMLLVKGLDSGTYSTVSIVVTDAATQRNEETISLKIKYDNDSKPPKLLLLDPLDDSSSISANGRTVKVQCTDASGIATLTCALGSTKFTATNSGDSIWSVNITGLTQNQYNKIVFIATDSSLKANKDTLSLYVNFDPTLDDNVGPVITRLTSLPATMVVTDSIISITDSVYDESGVDSVYWTRNGKNPRMLSSVVATATGGTYLLTDTLRRYHYDTIVVYAVDKSTAKNRAEQRIVVNYNVPPVAKDTSVSTVMNLAKAVVLTAASKDGDALTWSKLTDPAHGDAGITGATVTYTPATDWAGVDSFLVRVNDGIWSDTAKVRVTVVPTYSLTVNRAATGGTVAVVKDTAVYLPGTSVELTATPKTGYRFSGWSGDTSATANPLTVTVTKNSAITANYVKTFVVTAGASATVKGSVVVDAGASPVTVDSGTVVTFTASAKAGYRFTAWSGDTTATTNPLNYTIRQTTTITSNYIKTYQLTLVSSDAGKGNVATTAGTSPVTVDSGATVPISAVATDPFIFKKWSATGTNVTLGDATLEGTTVRLRGGNATVTGEFGCLTFKKQLSLEQYTDVSLNDAIQTADGGYLVVGNGTLIIKLNQWGDTVWTKVENLLGIGSSIRKSSAGYLIAGSLLRTERKSTVDVHSLLWRIVYHCYYCCRHKGWRIRIRGV